MKKWRYVFGAFHYLRTLWRRAWGRPAHVPPPSAVPTAPPSAWLTQLLAGPGRSARAGWPAAADALVQHDNACLPLVQAALAEATDEPALQRLAQVCARLASPAARQLLVALAQGPDLPRRAVALRALGSLPALPDQAHLFHQLAEEELRLAQHLLHGMQAAKADLRAALGYEVRLGRQRLLATLLQVYAQPPLLLAQRRLTHLASERQAEALDALAALLPQPLYRGVQALLDEGQLASKTQVLDDLLGPLATAEPVEALVVRRGAAAFSAWTISVALRRWHPQPATVAQLVPHLHATSALVRESARAVLQQLPVQRPAAYDTLRAQYPTTDFAAMAVPDSSSLTGISARARVQMLKGTTLFASTPENVLAAIVPIMQEVAYAAGQQIFAKGTLGTSLFIVSQGEVGIYDGNRHLATFGAGDFFGELALLDAEPRSATAVAHGSVVAFRLDQDDFYDVMEERYEVLRSILRVLCQRLRRQNEQTQVAA
ncbi:cyclic nucleotide-binding domain-containing protein [Hymenobacter setariae]|uniref:Cyclic nucleotide-binding domain-containing protein n=1 Tax=Hymenobacter setariae TaxID=2594794 RepID=A0A558BYQ1_9BACT|nr:cyclic nucleotide-binding domain-containing protein [Hymenobacter setariae]TVT41619.1 cyclic nucleotide-binding domain-containing protein [Hymenobacter setariae]